MMFNILFHQSPQPCSLNLGNQVSSLDSTVFLEIKDKIKFFFYEAQQINSCVKYLVDHTKKGN